jgi:hypothetical protein
MAQEKKRGRADEERQSEAEVEIQAFVVLAKIRPRKLGHIPQVE